MDISMTHIRGMARGYPYIFIILALIFGSVYQLSSVFYLIIIILISSLINSKVTKPVIFALCKQLNVKNIALRPKGAKNCGAFIDEYTPNLLSNTYGMPSGHSLESMIISVFLIMYVHTYHKNSLNKTILIIALGLVGISICISRVILGCHTIPQIIIGGVLGSIIGYYGFITWDTKIKPLFDNKYKKKN